MARKINVKLILELRDAGMSRSAIGKPIRFIWLRHTISIGFRNRRFFVTSFQISSSRKKTITYDLIVE